MIIRELTQEEADRIIYPLIPTAFQDTFSYSVMDIRSQIELDQAERLKNNSRKREFIFIGAFSDNNELMGYSTSFQMRNYELYTQTSVVMPEHRRKGVYSQMTKTILKLAKERGYQMVTSNHVAANNSVIMAKLKLGFFITGFEVVDDYGSLVKLTCFLNENRIKMFNVRTGFQKPDDEAKALLKI